ncbi:sigma-70 family RNA polymerase sigma factor [Rhizobium leguminosarum bv. viciae]|nr:sigma-70 family RNA polymerase sigma factor [Rhizobium leguminosarum bv. viciae]
MNALELFRTGKDYEEISQILKLPVPEVERRIHFLRSAEKGDTSQQDYRDHLRLKDEHRIALKRRYVGKANAIRERVPYIGKEAR